MKILILHPGGLGDIILSLPAVALVRKRHPSASITMAGNIDHLAPVGRPYIDRVVALATLPLHRLHSAGDLPEEDVQFWKSYDRIISWTGWGNSTFVHQLKRLHPHACIASWHPGAGEQRHVAQIFIDSLGPEFQGASGLQPVILKVDRVADADAARWLIGQGWRSTERLIALHPGAGSEVKRWPLSRFVDLALRLNATAGNAKLLIIEGPAEAGISAAVLQALPYGAAIAVPSVSLRLLAGLIARCEIFVGNDSGIAHLAAALNIPSVVLFGPTLPQHWAPLGGHVKILRDSSGCQACSSGKGEHTCLLNISVGKVLEAMRNS